MRIRLPGLLATTLLALVSAAGCRASREVEHERALRSAGSDDLEGRFKAASMIGDVALRDEALVAVADDAAVIPSGRLPTMALERVTEGPLRDAAAARCAAKLAMTARRDEALDVVKLIRDAGVKDDTLKVIAGAGF